MFVAVVFPPPQLNVAPPVVDEAVNVSLVSEHVRTTGVLMLTFGMLPFWVTVAAAVFVQPLLGSVTVTVYVAGAETE